MAVGRLAFKESFQRKQKLSLHSEGCLSFTFHAMASPCQILLNTLNTSDAKLACDLVEKEVRRIEKKYSRYTQEGIVSVINHSNGKAIEVDAETAALIDFADHCYHLSEGAFDISSGVLRKIWKFDSAKFKLPTTKQAQEILKHVGWDRVSWKKPFIKVPKGMELDFGGLGKEYAVDRCYLLLKKHFKLKFLLNFGGDIIVFGQPHKDRGWIVGVEDVNLLSNDPRKLIELKEGALATSGNTKRFVSHAGKAYGHILNTTTGFPIENAPRSVTVAAESCLNAGMLSTFAMLNGKSAEKFLKKQGVKYWLQW